MMRSFDARPDTVVVDEPSRAGGRRHRHPDGARE
ncbi:hypothetical protein ACIA5D_07335 [Actinoplanes sp. NPDC051513]